MRYRMAKGKTGLELVAPPTRGRRRKDKMTIDIGSKTMTFEELSEETGININTLKSRYYNGLREDDLIKPVMETPIETRKIDVDEKVLLLAKYLVYIK
jgi:hypothetical protein